VSRRVGSRAREPRHDGLDVDDHIRRMTAPGGAWSASNWRLTMRGAQAGRSLLRRELRGGCSAAAIPPSCARSPQPTSLRSSQARRRPTKLEGIHCRGTPPRGVGRPRVRQLCGPHRAALGRASCDMVARRRRRRLSTTRFPDPRRLRGQERMFARALVMANDSCYKGRSGN
jgi:hypothetical protein